MSSETFGCSFDIYPIPALLLLAPSYVFYLVDYWGKEYLLLSSILFLNHPPLFLIKNAGESEKKKISGIKESSDFFPNKQLSDVNVMTTMRFEIICSAGFF